jgi:hypothetical protein
MQPPCPGHRRTVGSSWRWRRRPLQYLFQVEVGAKALEVGKDLRPREPQQLSALGVDELQDLRRCAVQLFSQLAEEEHDRPVVFRDGG